MHNSLQETFMNLIPGDFVIKGSKSPETPENRQFAKRHAMPVGLLAYVVCFPVNQLKSRKRYKTDVF